MNHSLAKHKQLYSLFRDTGTDTIRHQLVYDFSEGRTEKSNDLTEAEIDSLIDVLRASLSEPSKSYKPGQRMRRRIFSMCYTIGWTKKEGTKQRVDTHRLNAWMNKFSYLHKSLNDYEYDELPKLVTQFESFLKSEL